MRLVWEWERSILDTIPLPRQAGPTSTPAHLRVHTEWMLTCPVAESTVCFVWHDNYCVSTVFQQRQEPRSRGRAGTTQRFGLERVSNVNRGPSVFEIRCVYSKLGETL
jgi:hypothetical protein